MTFTPWSQAWQNALYAPKGFYRRPEGPAGHFTTSAQGIPGVSSVMAQAIGALAEQHQATVIVDFACGRGELAQALAEQVSADVEIIAIDIVERPADLDQRVRWMTSPGGQEVPGLEAIGGRRALVLVHEWLDVVPCTIAEMTPEGALHEVLVNDEGVEALGGPLSAPDMGWIERHGPNLPELHATDGHRIEIGRARDEAWSRLIAATHENAAGGSLVLGIDYAITAETAPPWGTLTGFQGGTECQPVPDGSCDITSHVRTDSLRLTAPPRSQREVLLDLFGEDPLRPVPLTLASSHPQEYLERLTLQSAFATAVARGGLGDFSWFLHQL